MSGTQRLTIVGIEIAENQKRRPDWFQFAIGINVAIWLHAGFFLLLAWPKNPTEIYQGPPISIVDTEVIPSELIYGTPIIRTQIIQQPSADVGTLQWPIIGMTSKLQDIQFAELEEEDEFDLMGWFGPSMIF